MEKALKLIKEYKKTVALLLGLGLTAIGLHATDTQVLDVINALLSIADSSMDIPAEAVAE